MNRRGFLGSILAACAAPAIVRADALMRIVPTESVVLLAPQDCLITVDQIIKEALRIIDCEIDLAAVNRAFDEQFAFPSAKVMSLRLQRAYA